IYQWTKKAPPIWRGWLIIFCLATFELGEIEKPRECWQYHSALTRPPTHNLFSYPIKPTETLRHIHANQNHADLSNELRLLHEKYSIFKKR
ncbi:hypothetical protein, partial [Chromobacterium haemolyticum]|uniref:hypothetical protein n=1 Tax=Chromobacterium haemolyticum TaxID=394935 RepID=UPI001F1B9929